MVLGGDRDEMIAGLAALAAGQAGQGTVQGTVRTGKTVFLFPGQGSQWAGMGRELTAASPVFAAKLAECGHALAPYVDWDLAEVLAGAPGAPPLAAADVVQPALWAVMVSLAAVWQAAGVTPDAVAGHSQGEIAAATVAGILTLDDAAKVVAVRSRALSGLGVAGGMVSVVMSEEQVRELAAPWADRLAVAAVNGPAAVVVSGETQALTEFEAALAARRVLRWRIPGSDFVAHSPLVEPLAGELEDKLADVAPRAGRVRMFSTVSCQWLNGPELDAGYWYANVRQTVRFADAVRALADDGFRSFLEVSPHPVLEAAIAETTEQVRLDQPPLICGTLHREDSGARRFALALARAHARGVPVDWAAALGGGRPVELPTYTFQRQRFWPAPVDYEALLARAADGRRDKDKPATEGWRYRVSWTPVPASGPGLLTGRWLLVAPPGDGAAGELAAACLRAMTTAGAGAELVQVGDGAGRDALAVQIAEALGTDGPGLAGVVSLLAAGDQPVPGHPAVARGLAATLALVQALGDAGIGAPLWVLTRGAIAVGAADAPGSRAQAQTWGLGRVAALEHADRWGGLVDLPSFLDERAGSRLCQVLAGCGENEVAIRPAGLLARRLVRAPVRPGRAGRWAPRGTVLVTGGTGAVAGHVARWTAGRGAHRLVLSSRSGPAAGGAAGLAAGLAARGTAVDVLACDTAERDQVAGLLARIDAAGPSLTAVMHAAGVLDDGVLDRLDTARLASVAAAKAGGAAHLDELTAGRDLDAFVLFSSVATVLGGPGQANYAAANAALDALAEQRRGRGLPATSVAWGRWGGGGLAQASDVVRTRLNRGALLEMDPDLAVEALGQALDGDDGLLTVMAVDWARFGGADQLPLLRELPDVRQAAASREAAAPAAQPPQGELARQLAGLSRAEQERALTNLVREGAAAVLGHASPDAIEPDRAFSELGFDSLSALELRQAMSAATGLQLPATLLFDYPTAAVLARHLQAGLLAGAVDAGAAAGPGVAAGDPVAIVAMSCRFPGRISSPEELWELVAAGGDAISGFPADRGWDLANLYDPDPDNPGTCYVREGGFLHDAAGFDAAFFGISPREALAMDPQQRLLLEVSWEALERAGLDPAALRGSQTGVFVGGHPSGYGLEVQLDPESAESSGGHLLTGLAGSIMSGRVSYALGLEGPAATVDTSCSSSLVVLHMAGQALRAGECDLALAGGVTILTTPGELIGFSRQRGLAEDGRCKPFGAAADGMSMAEGIGMVVLERLSDARRHGHQVLAVIAGSAVNQDGASNGLTAPNGPSQQRVIRAALASAGVAAAEVDAVEAHGTGTRLGDPIEAQALLATYGQGRPEDRPLWLGSVKSNIGHTQSAAGVAGVIKMVLALQHGVLPRTLHADEPSPEVDWQSGAVRLLTEPVPWPGGGERPRRAGVSSFGFSGTNAHVIVAEAPDVAPGGEDSEDSEDGGTPVLAPGAGPLAWLVSGRSAAGLAGQAARLAEWAAAEPDLDLTGAAWSLATTRSPFPHRAVLTAADRDGLIESLAALAAGRPGPGTVTGTAAAGVRVGFVFSGQGSQRAGMAAGLHAASPVFASVFDRACGLLEGRLGVPVGDVALGRGGNGNPARADQTLYAQAGLVAVQAGLVAVLAQAGIVPEAVAGHSVGEIAASYAAGVLSLEDACALAAARAELMQALPDGGAMYAIAASEAEVTEALAGVGGAVIAAVNGPAQVVISGDAEATAEVAAGFAARGVRTRPLRVSHAFHSARMDPVLGPLSLAAADLDCQPPAIAWASTLTGEFVDRCEPGYWARQAREPVRYANAVTAMAARGITVFVEIGPDGTLTALGPAALTSRDEEQGEEPAFVAMQRPTQPAATALLTALAAVHVRGGAVDWAAVPAGPAGRAAHVRVPAAAVLARAGRPRRTDGAGGRRGRRGRADRGRRAVLGRGRGRGRADARRGAVRGRAAAAGAGAARAGRVAAQGERQVRHRGLALPDRLVPRPRPGVRPAGRAVAARHPGRPGGPGVRCGMRGRAGRGRRPGDRGRVRRRRGPGRPGRPDHRGPGRRAPRPRR